MQQSESNQTLKQHLNAGAIWVIALLCTIATVALVWLKPTQSNLLVTILQAAALIAFVLCAKTFLQLANENIDLEHKLQANQQKVRTSRHDLDVLTRSHQRTEKELLAAREASETALKAKSEFMANMSHEIRTPMNGVLGMTELLLSSELNRKQRHLAETIHRCGEQLLALINDVLDLSKIEAGKLELNESVFDIRTLFEDVHDMFAQQAHRQHIALNFVCAGDVHQALRGDSFRLKQIIVNLIGNAVKFTHKGEVVSRVTKLQDDAQRIRLRIEISDTGIGIREEAKAKLFQAFSQADSSTTREFGGTGLGLAICAQLTRLMGGRIGVDSVYGQGSTFWVELPFEKSSTAAVQTNCNVDALKGTRVLIVDANANSRQAIRVQLQTWKMEGLAVEKARHALAALQKASARGKPIDVVIFDQDIPDMKTIEMVHSIRATPDIASVRMVMLTSAGHLDQTGQWLVAGVDSYVDKPVRQIELQNCLLRVLGRAKRVSMESTEVRSDEQFTAHVLVAEDNPVNQELIVAVLEGFGCRSRVVPNGREAVEAITSSPLDLAHDPYDLILMDCQMPELDGYAATAAIRDWESSETSRQRLPIIALTANALPGDRERCLKAGMDDYLAKPLRRPQLAQVLKRWLPLQAHSGAADLSEKRIDKPEAAPGESVFVVDGTNASFDGDNAVAAVGPSAADSDVIDMQAMEQIRALQRQGMPDVLVRVVTLYLDKSPDLLKAIRAAVESSDAAALHAQAHSLKSSSANVGASRVTQACRELEQMGRTVQMQNAGAMLSVLENEYNIAAEALRGLLTSQAA
ncbi:MAG: response regulator [Gammaproteobacteria bacterium]